MGYGFRRVFKISWIWR